MALADLAIQVIISTCVFHVIKDALRTLGSYVDPFWFLF